jgi:hypothetical protein
MSLNIIKHCRNSKIEDLFKWQQAIKIAGLNDQGCGYLHLDDLPNNISRGNGKTWARIAELHFKMLPIKDGNVVIAYKFLGFEEKPPRPKVPVHIKNKLRNRMCIFSATHANVEIDHKYSNSPHEYEFYLNNDFKNEPQNYQPTTKVINCKKREEKKKRADTGYKFDNRLVNCAFSTTRYTLKDNAELITIHNPYDGEYWTDPIKTIREDYRYYTIYFNKFKKLNQKLSFQDFENIYLPKINSLIRDNLNINEINKITDIVFDQQKTKYLEEVIHEEQEEIHLPIGHSSGFLK